MNLSEKLNLNYCNSDVLKRYEDSNNPYNTKLLELKRRQDAGEMITDAEYQAIPIGGSAQWYSPANGYFHVNFHYNFYNAPSQIDNEVEQKFIQFLSVVDFVLCTESEILNWRAAYNHFLRLKYGYDWGTHYDSALDRIVSNISNDKAWEDEHFTKLEAFICKMLEFIDPSEHHVIDDLLYIERAICPDIFDNVVRNFRVKNNYFKYIEEEYLLKPSLKAKDVMDILGISRRTLSTYVKNKLIIIDAEINGKYRYNKQSVFNLLKNRL